MLFTTEAVQNIVANSGSSEPPFMMIVLTVGVAWNRLRRCAKSQGEVVLKFSIRLAKRDRQMTKEFHFQEFRTPEVKTE